VDLSCELANTAAKKKHEEKKIHSNTPPITGTKSVAEPAHEIDNRETMKK
jgi:hypothetical protein